MNNEQIKAKVIAMKDSGHRVGEIAEWLNNKGLTSSRGNKFTPTIVFSMVARYKKGGNTAVSTARKLLGNDTPVESGNIDTALIGLIDNPRFSGTQKLAALRALWI